MGKGVPFLEAREKNHFIRVDAPEWQQALAALGRRSASHERPGQEAADHVGHDRVDRVRGPARAGAPFGRRWSSWPSSARTSSA
jgi:hypothetical protein